ncbi:hypothetical protein BN2475_1180025 [Paraburkholderia ribeironis]|uniref:Uncharacterized protein n=1 Tax=Paraburkholderia ribeironis TaxID=1247936 RepID=A0A1N7SNE7_9BURK|nr:hypothetical protein BN2475_1180025 [Paraburkholderia ribeironis]
MALQWVTACRRGPKDVAHRTGCLLIAQLGSHFNAIQQILLSACHAEVTSELGSEPRKRITERKQAVWIPYIFPAY